MRLRRAIAVADLAVRAGTSPSSIARLERGDPGVAIGTLADVLVVLGLLERLADLVDPKGRFWPGADNRTWPAPGALVRGETAKAEEPIRRHSKSAGRRGLRWGFLLMVDFVAHVALGESLMPVGQLRFTHSGPR